MTYGFDLRAPLALLVVCGAGHAQDEPLPGPADVIASLEREYDASKLGYVEKYAAFKPRFEAFADAHRGTAMEVTARLWLLQQCWWLRESGKMESTSGPIADDLLARHLDSEQLEKLTQYYYVFDRDQRERVFTALLESPHRAVQAGAHLALAKITPPKPGWRATTPDPDQAHPHLRILAAEYTDVPCLLSTYGELADAYLNAHTAEQLAIGQVAPEIRGVDQNGTAMKLSDFRGKVVLLDFWGDW